MFMLAVLAASLLWVVQALQANGPDRIPQHPRCNFPMHALGQLFSCRQRNGTLTLLSASGDAWWLHFLVNQVLTLERLHVHNWVVLAADPRMESICRMAQIPCIAVSTFANRPYGFPRAVRSPQLSGALEYSLTKQRMRNATLVNAWFDSSVANMFFSYAALSMGLQAVFMDADVCFARDPWALLEAPQYRGWDMLMMRSGIKAGPDGTPDFNTGVLYARPTPAVLALYKAWHAALLHMLTLDAAARQEQYPKADQSALYLATIGVRQRLAWLPSDLMPGHFHKASWGACGEETHLVHLSGVPKWHWVQKHCGWMWHGNRCEDPVDRSCQCRNRNALVAVHRLRRPPSVC